MEGRMALLRSCLGVPAMASTVLLAALARRQRRNQLLQRVPAQALYRHRLSADRRKQLPVARLARGRDRQMLRLRYRDPRRELLFPRRERDLSRRQAQSEDGVGHRQEIRGARRETPVLQRREGLFGHAASPQAPNRAEGRSRPSSPSPRRADRPSPYRRPRRTWAGEAGPRHRRSNRRRRVALALRAASRTRDPTRAMLL